MKDRCQFATARALAAVCSFLVFTSAGEAVAATRYVAPTGSNLLNDCSSPGTPCATVQHALDQALAGDTIEIATATYAEQIAITKANIVVNGNGATLKPATLTVNAAQENPCSPGLGGASVVLVSGVSGVVLNDLNVDGLPAGGGSPPFFNGILYKNAGGAINGGTVRDVRYNPFSGVQTGAGIRIQASAPNAPNVDITGVTVIGYQKGGIVYNGCGCANIPNGTPTGTVSGCTVTGAGPTTVTAQNGIQVGFGAGPVTITGNTVSGNLRIGDPAVGTATGILLFSTKNNSVVFNEVFENQDGIVVDGGSFNLCTDGDGTGNSASCNTVRDNVNFGIFTDALLTSANMNSITGNLILGAEAELVLGTLDATQNWWGCAAGPGNPGCDSAGASVDASSPLSAEPACIGGTTTTLPTTTTTTTTTTNTTTTTLATGPTCAVVPLAGCMPTVATKGRLVIIDKTPGFAHANDKLVWKYRASASTAAADFGDPTSTTDLSVCLYEESGGPAILLTTAGAPAGGVCAGKPCWKAKATGFVYKDRDAIPQGVQKLAAKAGSAGKGRVVAKAKGVNLDTPTLPLLTPVRVQLQRSDASTCFEAVYTTAAKNSTTVFKAKSD